MEFRFLGKTRSLLLSNFIASIIFFVTGLTIVILNSMGKLGKEDTDGFAKIIATASSFVNQYVGGNILLNIVFLILLIVGAFYISKKI